MISKRIILDWLKTESESCFGTEDIATAALKEFKRLYRVERAAKLAADDVESLCDPEIGENTRGEHRDPLFDVVDELREALKKGGRK